MKKILLYNSGGGLGDSIQLFSLILSLQNHYKKAEFFCPPHSQTNSKFLLFFHGIKFFEKEFVLNSMENTKITKIFFIR